MEYIELSKSSKKNISERKKASKREVAEFWVSEMFLFFLN